MPGPEDAKPAKAPAEVAASTPQPRSPTEAHACTANLRTEGLHPTPQSNRGAAVESSPRTSGGTAQLYSGKAQFGRAAAYNGGFDPNLSEEGKAALIRAQGQHRGEPVRYEVGLTAPDPEKDQPMLVGPDGREGSPGEFVLSRSAWPDEWEYINECLDRGEWPEIDGLDLRNTLKIPPDHKYFEMRAKRLAGD